MAIDQTSLLLIVGPHISGNMKRIIPGIILLYVALFASCVSQRETSSGNDNAEFVVIGYVPGFRGELDETTIDPLKITHINYAFGNVTGGKCAIGDAYAATDLAVARAGTMTLAELFAWQIPAVLIPLPTAAADHQTLNARTLEQAGTAVHLPQSGLTGQTLGATVTSLLQDEPRLRALAAAAAGRARPNAAAEKSALVAAVVLAARHSVGISAAKRRMASCSETDSVAGCWVSNCSYSPCRAASAANACSHCRSKVRATKRCSGSTAWYWRAARSTS